MRCRLYTVAHLPLWLLTTDSTLLYGNSEYGDLGPDVLVEKPILIINTVMLIVDFHFIYQKYKVTYEWKTESLL